MNSEIESRHLRALIAVADEGTFTDAAITLGVSQSAMSRTLIQFEQIVGVTLVRRTTRTLSLTPAGLACYPAAVDALRALEAVGDAATGRIRPLRIGYSWAAFGRHTTAILRAWRAAHPEQPVEVHRIDERTAGLRNGAVDLAVIRSALTDPTLHERMLFVEGRLAAVPTGHPLAGIANVSLAQLAGETLAWTPTIGTTTLDLWEPGAGPVRTVEVDNVDEWLTVIAAGDAVGLTPESTSFTHSHPGVRFRPVQDVPPVSVRLAWPRVSPHPAVEIFADLARNVVENGELI
ncbi:DNA-binding transcriptional LysR family regulator [Nakamurella sp. UYEF19]|uniref:LysR family transcriptional regulator n=1 Tax=Nakamurella sp. UYEF19 TaxID=1756392 RepID=UPI0033952998